MRFKGRRSTINFFLVLLLPAVFFSNFLQTSARAEEATLESFHARGFSAFFSGDYAAAIPLLEKAVLMAPPGPPGPDLPVPTICDAADVCRQVIPPRALATGASCLLGDLHALGMGTPRDIRAAAGWWLLGLEKHDALLMAAEKGDVLAQTELGDLYLSGPCRMNVDPARRDTLHSERVLVREEALVWYAKAGKAGHAPAALKAGKLVNHFMFPLRDRQEALEWYRMAATAGIPEGQHLYGLALRREGRYAEGLRWIRKAEAQGYAPAKKYLDVGRTNEIHTTGSFEMIFVLLLMAAAAVSVFLVRKKKPLRAYMTRRNFVKAFLYVALVAVTFETIVATPALSRAFDRIFLFIMRSRAYMPDAVADNMYLFAFMVILALVVFVWLVSRVKVVFFSALLRRMNTEPDRKKDPGGGKPD